MVCLVLLGLGVALYFAVVGTTYARLDDSLTSRARLAAQRYDASGIRPAAAEASGEQFLVLAAASGVGPKLGSGLPASVRERATSRGSALATYRAGNQDTLRVAVKPLASGGFAVAADHLEQTQGQLNGLLSLCYVVAVATLLVAVGAIWLVAGAALRPLRSIAATAVRVGRTQDLSLRLPRPEVEDEVAQLSTAFNAMLAQLESSLESQRRFVADASHELRSPLTSIRSNAELLLRPGVPESDRREALADLAGESARLSSLVDGLLALARADAGQPLPLEEMRLDEVVRAEVGQVDNVHLDLAPTVVQGNPAALARVTANLVGNALRHARGEVWVRVRDAALVVEDDGPGIPDADLERVFERFYQADPARSGTGSAGLGLAITRSLVEAHGGSIRASARAGGGAVLTVALPALTSA